MASWNTQYSSNPPDDNNPGYGAAAIRDLKTNIEGIVGNEHKFTFEAEELGKQGQHKPGSAIVDMAVDTENIKANNGQIGRLTGATVEVISGLETYEKTTLKVNGETEYLNVEGYNQVSLNRDETINGIKTFVDAPAITQTVNDESSDTTIANVGYVKTKNTTTAIEPTLNNVSPVTDLDIDNIYGTTLTTIEHVSPNSENLEELLSMINVQLQEVRTGLVQLGLNNPFDQNLRSTDSPTFDIVTATKITGAVWG